MIILQTLEGREHQLQAGDRLSINTEYRTAAFTTSGGNSLQIRGDSKVMIPSIANSMGPAELAVFIAALAGLSLTKELESGNTVHLYVFTDNP